MNTTFQYCTLLCMKAKTLMEILSLFSVDITPLTAALEAILQVLRASVVAHRDDSLISCEDTSNTSISIVYLRFIQFDLFLTT